jgi:mannose-6-phosphate isomerase-like protein (cupin superfamily)
MATDITALPIHLGPGGTARVVEGFDWSPERLAEYERATRADGPDGRLVMMFEVKGEWSSWERHPAGAEVVIACTGTHRFVQELEDGDRVVEHVVELGPGEALINPPGVWHTADSGQGGWIVAITPGLDTEHRPRS